MLCCPRPHLSTLSPFHLSTFSPFHPFTLSPFHLFTFKDADGILTDTVPLKNKMPTQNHHGRGWLKRE